MTLCTLSQKEKILQNSLCNSKKKENILQWIRKLNKIYFLNKNEMKNVGSGSVSLNIVCYRRSSVCSKLAYYMKSP